MQATAGTHNRRLMRRLLPIIQDDVGALHQLHSPQRKQTGIAWSSADQVDVARPTLLPCARQMSEHEQKHGSNSTLRSTRA